MSYIGLNPFFMFYGDQNGNQEGSQSNNPPSSEESPPFEPEKSGPTRSSGPCFENFNHNAFQKALFKSSVAESGSCKVENEDKLKHQMKIQEVETLLQKFSEMPECAEKNLLILQYISKLEQLPSSENNFPSFNFQETFTQLKERISLEELGFSFMETSLANCEAHFERKDWKSASESITQLLPNFRVLDIQEILRLVQKSQTSVKSAAGQHIAMFFGPTGSGKSTTVHYLAGSEMDRDKESGHIFPRIIKNKGLENITVSASTKSETKEIISVTVNFADIEGGFGENEPIILCDAPGSKDTAGPEVDIANSINMKLVIESSKSVKPVFVISNFGQSDRHENFKDMIHFVKEIIPEVGDYRKSVTFMLTKFPKDKIHGIQKAIETIISDAKFIKENAEKDADKVDKTYLAILEDMLEKIKSKELIIIDPIEDKKPGEILNKIAKTDPIMRPGEIFKFVLSQTSRGDLEKQRLHHGIAILKALKRSDFELIKFKLDELNKLRELIEDETFEKLFLDCVKVVNDYLGKEYNQASLIINTCMNEGKSLSEGEIQKYKEKSRELKTLADLIKIFHGEGEFDLVKSLEKQIDNLLQKIEDKTFDDPILKSASDKLHLISKHFPQFSDSYEKANTIIRKSFDKACENYSTHFNNEQFQESEAELTKIKNFCLLSTEKYQQLKEDLLKKVKSWLPKIEKVLKKYKLTLEDIEIINSEISKLNLIKRIYVGEGHISKEEVESVCESCADKIQLSFEMLVQNIKKQIEIEGFECLSTIQESFTELRLIRDIKMIENRTFGSYFQLLEKVRGLTQGFSKKITENLDFDNNKINSPQISKMLRLLSKNQWIDNFENKLYSKTLDDIQEEVLRFYSHLKEFLNSLFHGHKVNKWIQKAYETFGVVNNMGCFEEILPASKTVRLEIIDLFEGKINDYHDTIKKLLEKYNQRPIHSLSEFEFEESEKLKLEGFLLYVEACEGIPRATDKYSEIKENLEEFLKKYRDHLSKKMTKCFDSINEYRKKVSEKIKEPDSSNNSQESFNISFTSELLLKNVQDGLKTISKVFEFLGDIKSQYPSLYGIFDSQGKLEAQWKRKLIQDQYNEIVTDLAQFQCVPLIKSLKRMLALIKLLRSLDEFLPQKNEYRKLYNDYNGSFPGKVKEKKDDIIRAINAGEYESIQFLIDDFMADPEDEGNNHNEKKNLNEIQTKLGQHVDNLLRETGKIVNSFTLCLFANPLLKIDF